MYGLYQLVSNCRSKEYRVDDDVCLGALEPLTAVILGVALFNEALTTSVLIGLALIIPAVIMVIFTRGRK